MPYLPVRASTKWCISPISWLREALLVARRGPVVHRATTYKFIADFDFNGKYLKLRCANLYLTFLFSIFMITLIKKILVQILKHKQLKYRFTSLHVRAADKNDYLFVYNSSRNDLNCIYYLCAKYSNEL